MQEIPIGGCVRQGDVLLLRVQEPKKNMNTVPRDNGKVVLAYGEVTGHSHSIEDRNVELLETVELSGPIERFLIVMEEEGTCVLHEEHDTIFLSPGTYRVIIQRECVPEAAPRTVID